MTRRRLVLMVEGEGDVEAVPMLVKRLLAKLGAFDLLSLAPHPIRVGTYSKICKDRFADWRRYLNVCRKRRDFGAALLLLDGDSHCIWTRQGPLKEEGKKKPFCAMQAAQILAEEAQAEGAGSLFSVAVVFACQEFESWLIAGAESLVGRRFPDGRMVFPDRTPDIPPNPEIAPRDAKSWLGKRIPTGYNAPRDQANLAEMVDLELIRPRMRSFRRLESAVKQLVEAIRSGQAVVTPSGKREPYLGG
ncbi:MAG: DUF4276 family protein [Thermoguttaceae bacterium]|nr:DUF4276 family protein [Thermoguttaceae bacterium]MDW8038811.1 DUF4276 family protein [Thermoguttaceae bacterium]